MRKFHYHYSRVSGPMPAKYLKRIVNFLKFHQQLYQFAFKMCAHVPSHLHKYINKYLLQLSKEPSEYAIILIPLSKNKAHYKMAAVFMSFARENAREAAWKIITKGIQRYLSNYSKSPCYRRDKAVYACDKKSQSLPLYRAHTPF